VTYCIPGAAHLMPATARARPNGTKTVSLERSISPAGGDTVLSVPDDGHGISHGLAKPPIKQFIESPNFSSRNGTKIDMIVLHFTDGPSARSAINHFLDQASQVSAHYIVDRNGDIYQMVRDTEKAWHAKAANPRSIGIEHVAMPDQHMSGEQEQASVALVKWLIATYSIPLGNILGHRFAPGNLGTTDCPDHLFGDATKDAVDAWVMQHFAAPAVA
jgi:N-acetylmuramoyl-L-alanine amidase